MQKLNSAREIDQLVTLGGKFLRTLSTKSDVMELMLGLGYTDPEHRQGWDLYLRMLGYKGGALKLTPGRSTSQSSALAEIDKFDEPAFRRSSAALLRLHPEQYAYIFGDGLTSKTGPESVGSVQTYLDRYAALRDGTDPERADSREQDRAAAATLEARRIVSPEKEKHLRELIDSVKQPAPPRSPPSVSEETMQTAAQEFGAWLQDWRTTASAGIVRRDYRIMLGISRRRSPEDAQEPATEPTPLPPGTHA